MEVISNVSVFAMQHSQPDGRRYSDHVDQKVNTIQAKRANYPPFKSLLISWFSACLSTSAETVYGVSGTAYLKAGDKNSNKI